MEARPLPIARARLPAGLAHLRHERIVAAGIEDDELHLARAGDLAERARQRHGLVLDVALLLQGGIDGDEIVGAADLDTMTGKVDHGPVGAGRHVTELLERLAEHRQVGVDELAHLGEAQRAQHGGNCLGVVGRVAERRCVLVVAVADDQGDAPFGRLGAFRERLGEPGELPFGARNDTFRIPGFVPSVADDDLLVVGQRQVDRTLFLIGMGSVAVGQQVFRVDAQHLAVVGNRLVELALLGQGEPAVRARRNVARVDLDGFFEVGKRGGKLAFAQMREATAVAGTVTAGIEPQQFVVVGDGAIVLTQLEQCPATATVQGWVLSADFQRLVEIEHGQRKYPLGRVGGGAAAVGQHTQGVGHALVREHARAGLDPAVRTLVGGTALPVRFAGCQCLAANDGGQNKDQCAEHRSTSCSRGDAPESSPEKWPPQAIWLSARSGATAAYSRWPRRPARS